MTNLDTMEAFQEKEEKESKEQGKKIVVVDQKALEKCILMWSVITGKHFFRKQKKKE